MSGCYDLWCPLDVFLMNQRDPEYYCNVCKSDSCFHCEDCTEILDECVCAEGVINEDCT
jgi:hypothetical protein